MLYKSRIRKRNPDINNIGRQYPDSRVTSVRLECKMCTTRVLTYALVSFTVSAPSVFNEQTISACLRMHRIILIESRTHFTLQYCNDKTGLGVYQRYYSILCNTLPYPVKQREALCENYRITCKSTRKNCYKMYYWILCALWSEKECENYETGRGTIMFRKG